MDPSCLWSPQVVVVSYAWWRHQMEAFSALLVLCDRNPPVTGGFPLQRPVTRSFEFFFDLLLNKRLSKQSRPRWFETPSRSLWHHCNGSWCYKLLNVMQNICCPADRTETFSKRPWISSKISRRKYQVVEWDVTDYKGLKTHICVRDLDHRWFG